MPPAPSQHTRAADSTEAAVRAFTRDRSKPGLTLPLTLLAVVVAVVAMHVDRVAAYSVFAFWTGLAATIALAVVVGRIVSSPGLAVARGWLTIVLPTLGGAFVGMLVQATVLENLRLETPGPSPLGVYDLGGLVSSQSPVGWILGGAVLGAVPALAVALFLALAARAVRRITGHDASESFGVPFFGACGILGTFALFVVDAHEASPLVVVVVISALNLLVSLLIDGARLRFVARVFSGKEDEFEVTAAERFTGDPNLAPLVASAGAASVLVRVDKRPASYRTAAAVPIALVASSEREASTPLHRRRTAATLLLVTISVWSALAFLVR